MRGFPVVLIVEDEWLLRDSIAAHLRASQWCTLEARTGEPRYRCCALASTSMLYLRIFDWPVCQWAQNFPRMWASNFP
jgi:DNA-binding response OmpR family regulator